jgi:hypothetical protein
MADERFCRWREKADAGIVLPLNNPVKIIQEKRQVR